MPTFVEVAVNVSQVSKSFHYHLPPELDGQVDRGYLVTVPFGTQTVQGIVLDLVPTASVAKTKAVIELLDPEPVLTPAQIGLAAYLAPRNLTSLAACISLMLPPGLSQMADTLYQAGITEDQLKAATTRGTLKLSDAQWRLLTLLLDRGPLRGRQIDRALPRKNWKSTAQALKRRKLVATQPILNPPTVKPKVVRTAQLACSLEEAEAQMESLGRKGYPALERRQCILRLLMREEGPLDVSWIYAESGGNLSDLRVLAEKGLLFLGESEQIRDPLDQFEFVTAVPPELTREQRQVWGAVQAAIEAAAGGGSATPILLYGVTGSGKTEIYLRALQAVIERGRQAIILVPEIALTPQTVRRFLSRFPDQVGLVHSKLSPGERYDTWRRSRAGLLSAVVGPRSALFTPFPDIGLIVVDECHDQSYYQSEMPPSYHARDVAVAYARQLGAVCLMGSATPDIVSTYTAARGTWTALRLPERILAHKEAIRRQLALIEGTPRQTAQLAAVAPRETAYRPLEKDAETIDLPPVDLVDMRAELKAGNRSIFSRLLHRRLGAVLEQGEQAILFINRRGMATYVFCRDCGYTLKCHRCDIPLTQHLRGRKEQAPALETRQLICHRCNYQRNMPSQCPQCGSSRIKHYGTGTERVEQQVKTAFPGVATLRWDWGTTRKKGAHDVILRHFANHQADVLIGTQMLAKGLDLPLVTLVGVVLADVGLSLPDYRAAERTFQVLTQVAGRAGRSPLGGSAILQTFQPDHYAIQAASEHDYHGFYQRELAYRRQLGYPPFSRLVRLEFRHLDERKAQAAARQLTAQVRGWIQAGEHCATDLIGPAPCFFSRVSGYYRWQLVLRGPNPVDVLKDKRLGEARVEVDPLSLL
jgi:primosomal protein N' (replication factor Y)